MTEKFKIYIVNLQEDHERRRNILNQIKNQKLYNFEIIDAINGNELTQIELNNLVFKNKKLKNPWNTKMSPSQIGCALSHIKIYKKFINSEYDYALILEDDAVFINNFSDELKSFILKSFKFKKQIILLSELKEFFSKPIDKQKNYELVNVTNAFFTHSYFINKEAAKSIIEFNYPVKTIADNFVFFKIYCGVKLTGLNPFILEQDKVKFQTSISNEKSFDNIFLIKRSLYKMKYKFLKKLFKFESHNN